MVSYIKDSQLLEEPALTETTAAPAVTGFHHFSPTVSDVEASAQWYERVFGMNRVPGRKTGRVAKQTCTHDHR
jgi:catechol-2,3-dioxygenase